MAHPFTFLSQGLSSIVTPTQNSSLLTLQGNYWNGAESTNVGFSLQNIITDTSPTYKLSFQNALGTEIASLSETGNLTLSALSTNGAVYSNNGTLNSEQYLSPVRGGTGLNGTLAANGQLLIGNGNGFLI